MNLSNKINLVDIRFVHI